MVSILRLPRGFREAGQDDLHALYGEGYTQQNEFQEVVFIVLWSTNVDHVFVKT